LSISLLQAVAVVAQLVLVVALVAVVLADI
jgi:hypothetical protein